MSILFLSDNHYGTHGGRTLFQALRHEFEITFAEDSYNELLTTESLARFRLLVTCAIGDTPGAPHAPKSCEKPLRQWLSTGVPILLLHGGSASFWQWSWWRELVGLRWVRQGDPDKVPPSTHPTTDYTLTRCKSRHPLAASLLEMTVPSDELYIQLEETRPIQRLLEASYQGQSYPMAYATPSPWGGEIVGYLPGHRPEVILLPEAVANIRTILRYLTQ